MHTPLEFSEEQVAIFTRRYEEGYDVIVDKHYVAWLEINHPGAIPPEKSPCQLPYVFSHVSPFEPVRQGSLSPTPCIDSQSERPHHLHPVLHPLQLELLILYLSLLLSVRCHLPQILSLKDHTHLHPVLHPLQLKVFTESSAKYLTLDSLPWYELQQFFQVIGCGLSDGESVVDGIVWRVGEKHRRAAKKKLPSAASSRIITGAGVLTSMQCLAILKEREVKKKKEEEKNEERRRIKEAKKKQREEGKQRKLEEKALKEQEKRRKDAEKE